MSKGERGGRLQLQSVSVKGGKDVQERTFPFTVPTVQSLSPLEFGPGVTFFVGENGSGKSTVLEGIAAAARLPAVGSTEIDSDETLAAQRRLAKAFTLSWGRRSHRGFFLRAEDFFGFTKRLAQTRAEMEQRLTELDAEYQDRSDYAKTLATGPMRTSIGDMTRRYGEDFDGQSHGERFLSLFRSRLVPDGLYLLDEPEAALSPQSQLAFLAMLLEAVGEGSQFIIATHSPILLAFPDARIFSFDTVPVRQVAYSELEHVALTRDFLADPQRYLRRLVNGD